MKKKVSTEKAFKEGREFVVGDIHGELDKLNQCLKDADFDDNLDTLVSLGDVVDRGPDSRGTVDRLLRIKNLIAIKGNHDDVFLDWMTYGIHKFHWAHGGDATIRSYSDTAEIQSLMTKEGDVYYRTNFSNVDIPKSHQKFFAEQRLWYKDKHNRLFCHGGFNRHRSITDQFHPSIFYWDRDLFLAAMATEQIKPKPGAKDEDNIKSFKVNGDFKRIFIGHTPTINFRDENDQPYDKPIYAMSICNLDTGSCFGGKLSLIDITDDENHILYQA